MAINDYTDKSMIEQIEKGIDTANKGEFASDAEVKEVFDKFKIYTKEEIEKEIKYLKGMSTRFDTERAYKMLEQLANNKGYDWYRDKGGKIFIHKDFYKPVIYNDTNGNFIKDMNSDISYNEKQEILKTAFNSIK